MVRRCIAGMVVSASLLLSLVAATALHNVADATTVAQPVEPGSYRSLPPTRLLDTRIGLGAPRQPLAGGAPLKVLMAGRAGLPSTGVAAVAVNVTVTQPTAAGVLTVYPGNGAVPNTSTLNFTRSQTVANLAVVELGTDGTIAALARMAGRVQLIMDVQGYYLAGNAQAQGAFVPVTPFRLTDTRTGLGGVKGPLTSGYEALGQLKEQVSVSAVVANVTVTAPTGSGYIEPGDSTTNSIVNFSRGITVANVAILNALDNDVWVTFRGTGSVQVIIDIYGYFVTGPRPGFLSKNGTLGPVWQRALDTRNGTGGFRGVVHGGATLSVAMPAHPFGPLSSIGAVAINLTVVSSTGSGYLTAYPAGSAAASTSNINFSPGQVIANMSMVGVGTSGNLTIHFGGTGAIAVIVDVDAATLAADIPPQTALALASSNVLSTSLSLNWQLPEYGSVTGYLIRRAEGATAPATATDGVQVAQITSTPSVSFPLNDACLAAGTTYSYSVFTEDGSAISAPATLTVTTQAAPTPNGMVAWGDTSVDHFGRGPRQWVHCGHPEAVNSLSNVQQAASAYGQDNYALKSDGTVWGFGPYVSVATGSGRASTVSTDVPVQVLPFQDVVEIATGNSVVYALRRDGTVWEAGQDASSSDGGYTVTGALVQVPGLQNMVSISAGIGVMGRTSAYGIKADGTLWGWGSDNASQFPAADVDANCYCVRQPVQLFGFTDVTGVAVGASTAYAVHNDGTVSAWGNNFGGALGDGGSENSSATPVSVAGLGNATAVFASQSGWSAYAVLSDGTVRSWGANGDGQLGDGTTTNRNTPVDVGGVASVRNIVAGGGDLVGTATAVAVLADGSVVQWGASATGAPTPPAAIPGVTGVASVVGVERSGFLYVEG